jgi:hypothetical protein
MNRKIRVERSRENVSVNNLERQEYVRAFPDLRPWRSDGSKDSIPYADGRSSASASPLMKITGISGTLGVTMNSFYRGQWKAHFAARLR